MTTRYRNRTATAATLVAVFLTLLAAAVNAQCFPVPMTFDASIARGVAAGDFNGDGRIDLAFTANNNKVEILLGIGRGSFVDYGASVVKSSTSLLTSIATADLNGDGRLDLAVTYNGGGTIMLGTGSGTFTRGPIFSAGTDPRSVAIGDLNGDGQRDLAVANAGSNSVSVLFGGGAGAFAAPVDFPVGPSPQSVAIADFNGDGRRDLAVANELGANVSILLGTGTGGFTLDSVGVGFRPVSVAVGDLDGDGKSDLATANSFSATVSVALGNGDGTFATRRDFAVGPNPRAVAIGDFDGDGRPDLATANADNNTASLLLGGGAGFFIPAKDFAVGASPTSLAAGDLDGEGGDDLAVAGLTGKVTIVYGTLSEPNTGITFGNPTNFPAGPIPGIFDTANPYAIGDFNGDGVPDLVAVIQHSNSLAMLPGSGAGGFGAATNIDVGIPQISVATADLNGDGALDLVTGTSATSNLFVQTSTASVLLGTGSGGFGPPTTFPLPSSPFALAIGDLDGDGKPDLVVLSRDHDVSVLRGTGSGGFGAATTYAASTWDPFSVRIGDVNGDGTPDLVVTNLSGNSVSILPGTGGGGFGAPAAIPTDYEPFDVAIGDFNGDGIPDLATANSPASTLSILLGTGAGAFGPPRNFPAGYAPLSIAAADFNGDGNLDLVTGTAILRGAGNGTFGRAHSLALSSPFMAIAIRDLDGDGKPDLIAGGSDGVTVRLNTAGPDTVAPATTAHAIPPPNPFGWNNGSSVTVTLTAEDCEGSGVQSITYAIGTAPAATVSGATISFPILTEGETSIDYVATDSAGNAAASKTLTVGLDRTAPTTTASVTPAPNANGWNNTPVIVSLTATDNAGGSGVQAISISSKPGGKGLAQRGGGPVSLSISAEGTTTITGQAFDYADNREAPTSFPVRIDTILPVLTVPANVTTDATGPAGASVVYSATATDESGLPPTVACAPASGASFPVGTTTVSCTASDAAGNASGGTFLVIVNGPSSQTTNLITLVDSFNLPAGTSNSLNSTLQNAINAFASGNTTVACNEIDAFINQVQAQSGKKLTVAQATQLIAIANQIRTAQGCP